MTFFLEIRSSSSRKVAVLLKLLHDKTVCSFQNCPLNFCCAINLPLPMTKRWLKNKPYILASKVSTNKGDGSIYIASSGRSEALEDRANHNFNNKNN